MRVFIALSAFALCAAAQDYRAPAGERPAVRRVGAESVLPGGRMVDPVGRQFPTGSGPFGLAISPDGKYAVTADGGPNGFSLTVLDMSDDQWRVKRIEAESREKREQEKKAEPDEDSFLSVFMGLAFQDAGKVFAAEGNSGRVRLIQIPSGRLVSLYELNQGGFRDSFSGDLAYDADRSLLYVVDQANFRVAVFDAKSRKLIANVRVGRLPFKVALSEDKRRLYVTNIGTFEYQPIPGADPKNLRETGLSFPAFGFPSKEAENGAKRQTAKGEVNVPGLGDPNAPQSNSLCVVDVADASNPKVINFIRTGIAFGPDSRGGASPSGVVTGAGEIFVSNGNQDSISVIDASSLRVVREIPLRIPKLESLRGILPLGMVLDLQNNHLLVAEAGINAVGVIDVRRQALVGHVPAPWFPSAVAAFNDQVFVAGAKGLGTGPNASMTAPLERSFQADLRRGAISVFSSPLPRALPILTGRVMALNGFSDRGAAPALPDAIQHVVIIVKENRTYDEVLGDIASAANGKVNGAPELARFGARGWLPPQPTGELKQRMDGVRKYYNITPNHHALAQRFAFSDNFYADSEVSVDGHHWIVGSYPNAWTTTSLMSSYGGQKDFRLPTSAPGRLAVAGSNSSVHPEDLLQAGTLWHHLEAHNIAFRNFGEGFELAGVDEGPGEKPTGARYPTNVPMPDPLYRNTSRDYPGFNMNIPDQYRATQFINEIDRDFIKPGKPLPRLIFIHLPNDHMAKVRPADGYPFQASYVADNDYALGRIVEYLSHTEVWKQMAILVTEDDAQGGVDHVDSHRTLFLAISPYAKRHYASHVNSSFPGLLKTAFRLLKMPPLNLYDAVASDLSDCFTSQPDFTPYDVLPEESVVFHPEKVRDPMDPQPQPKMDDPAFLRQQHRQ